MCQISLPTLNPAKTSKASKPSFGFQNSAHNCKRMDDLAEFSCSSKNGKPRKLWIGLNSLLTKRLQVSKQHDKKITYYLNCQGTHAWLAQNICYWYQSLNLKTTVFIFNQITKYWNCYYFTLKPNRQIYYKPPMAETKPAKMTSFLLF